MKQVAIFPFFCFEILSVLEWHLYLLDIFNWCAIIKGPPDTPYEGGSFELGMPPVLFLVHFTSISYLLDIVVPHAYPLQPPTVKFVTKVFHPNIHFKVFSLI